MVGTGLGAKRGILIKNGEALERAGKIDVVVFDKTGTLTEGKPKVNAVFACAPGVAAEDVLRLAASVEYLSEHPLAKAVVLAASEKKLSLAEISDFRSFAGKGVYARVAGVSIRVGNVRWMEEDGISVARCHDEIDEHEARAETVIAVARDHELIGCVAISDTLKADAKEAVARLKDGGIRIDDDDRRQSPNSASHRGGRWDRASLRPGATQGKAEQVRLLQQKGQKIAFVGDGINDAPALAQADLGIAIGTGTDIAIEAGNIVLVKGSPMKVFEALQLSRLTFRTIQQNLFWAFFYNIAAIPLAALGLLNPMIAAGAMAISSVSVVGNSLRIKRSVSS